MHYFDYAATTPLDPIAATIDDLELNRHGFAISTGSACQVGQLTSSKIRITLQVEPQRAKEFIRISFGKSTTLENVNALANQILRIQKEHSRTKTSIQYL